MSGNRTYSGTTSACQSCNIPPRCALEATVDFAGKTDVYRQEQHFVKQYSYLIEQKNGSEVPLKLTTKQMHCISKSPHCPTGNVFDETGALFADFNPEKNFDSRLPYTRQTRGFSFEENNPISVLTNLLTRSGLTGDPRYLQHYTMRLSECNGKPFLTLPRTVQIGAAAINPVTYGLPTLFIEGLRHLASARFNLILYRELTAKVTIGLESEIEEKTKDQRKEERRKQNVAAGYRPSHTGWTKHTGKYDIKKGLTIEGEVVSIIGSDRHGFTTELKQEFTKGKNKLSLINSIDNGFNTINNMLKKGKGADAGYPLVSTKFRYPILEIEGGIKTHQSESNGVITQGNVSVGFAPLFGFNITVDLLTAFIAFLGPAGRAINTARIAAGKQAEAVKDGEDGAYLIVKLDLTFSFGIHGDFKFKTDDYGKFVSDGRNISLEGEIIGDACIEGGARYFGISGFFKAGAEIKSTLIMAFDKKEGDDLTAVVYHEGVKAKVYTKFGTGENSDSKENGKISKKITPGEYEEWIIYDELDKEKSDWRFSLG